MTIEEQLALDQANAERAALDQAVCRSILEHYNLRRANGTPEPDRDLMAGDIVQTSAGETTVEQRHVDAVDFFHANYPVRSAVGITFQVQPA